MATAASPQVASTTTSAAEPREVAQAVREACAARRAIYPVGGGTALDYGAAASRPGESLDFSGLNRIVDYTPRDMTIVVEAGVRMSDLAATLAAESQHLPIDVPRAGEATIGGVVATNWSGPKRLSHGTIRDYVIGIHAVDGRGVAFKGGGRVVKNVAGYDFCKLLTGSLGTLGVITQLALKVKPQPETTATVVAACADVATAEILLDRLATLAATPTAVDYLLGPHWRIPTAKSGRQAEIGSGTPHLVIRVEGTRPETDWLADQIQTELQRSGGMNVAILSPSDAAALWTQQIEFADRGAGAEPDNSPMVVRMAAPASAVTQLVAQLIAFDPNCSIQSHAASGIVIARFAKFGHADLTPMLVGKLRPAVTRLGGSLVIVSSQLEGLTPHLVWGGRTEAIVLLETIKRQFDPHNILNPGRFVY